MRNYYGFSIIPAVAINGQSLYGRFMFSRARFKLATNVLTARDLEGHYSRNGGELGLGVNALVNRYLAIQTEYNWSSYGQFSQVGTFGTLSIDSTIQDT